jgi:hypothetical protein
MIVYSSSCSFGAPCSHPVYSEVVAKNLNCDLVNNGKSGSCNRRIIRTALRDCNELSLEHQDILVLIGLTFISRTELWRNDLPAAGNDGHFHSITADWDKFDWSNGLIDTIVPDIHKHVDSQIEEYYKQWLIHYDRESVMTELCADLLMLTGWFKSKNIKYIVFSNVDKLESAEYIGYNSPFISSLQQSLKQDPALIDPWEFSFGTFALEQGLRPKDENKFGKHGHPGKEAHFLFGEYLTDFYNNFYQNEDVKKRMEVK